MYALSASAITYGFNYMWLDSLILIPLVVAGLDDIMELKKPVLYVVSLSLVLITNYYMGFMVCIFLFIYFLYKLFLGKLNNKKEILRKITTFVCFSILAVTIAGIVLIPSAIGILEGRAGGEVRDFSFETNFKIKDGISKLFTGSFVTNEIGTSGMPPVFCGIFANFLILLYFTNSKIRLKEKILSFLFLAIFFISFYFEPVNLLWNMGNFPACFIYRYIFCFTFIYIFLAHKAFENIKSGTKLWNIIFSAVTIIMLALFVLRQDTITINKLYVKLDMCLTLIFFVIITIYSLNLPKLKIALIQKIMLILIGLISTVNVAINTFDSISILVRDLSKNEIDNYVYLTNYNLEKKQELQEDDGLYRIEKEILLNVNDGIVYGFNGINFSASTYSEKLHNFLKNLGYSKQHVTIARDTGSTKTMNMLFGIKYKIDKYIEKNDFALNLAFSVPSTILEEAEFDEDNAFKTQNNLLKKIAGREEEIFEKHQGKISRIFENIKIQDYRFQKENDEEAASVTYEFEIEKEENVYFYIALGTGLEEIKVTMNGKSLGKPRYGNFNKMFELGKHEIGEKIQIKIEPTKKMFVAFDDYIFVYYENEEILKKYYETLSKEQVELKQIHGNKLEGQINIQSDNEYILTTIPYDKGWEVKIDGKKVETINVQDAMMAIPCKKGEHLIELKFIPRGFKLGMLVSIIGITLLCMRCFYRKTQSGKAQGKFFLTYKKS